MVIGANGNEQLRAAASENNAKLIGKFIILLSSLLPANCEAIDIIPKLEK